jgi:predicted RNA-binding Zn ribbon-like protein
VSINAYPGPVRSEPPAVELYNTLYADHGEAIDGLRDGSGLRSWVAALGDRLPDAARPVDAARLDEFWSLRVSVRAALRAVVEGRPVPKAVADVLNEVSARNPESLYLRRRQSSVVSELRYHAGTPSDVALGVLAASTIDLVGRPHGAALRACGAPGCVLMFVKDHPRREWCSAACGNRARQARHYARSRGR